MNLSHPRRLLAAAGITVVATFGLAAPASAETPAPAAIDVFVGDASVAPGAGTAQIVWVHGPDSLSTLVKPVFTFDLGALAGAVTVVPDVADALTCRPNETVVTCSTSADAAVNGGTWTDTPPVTFHARTGTPVGTSATIKTTVSAGNVTTAETTWKLTIAEGVNLTAVPMSDISTQPGTSVQVPAMVTNNGTTTVNGTVLWMVASYGVTLTSASNCTYVHGPTGETIAACTFDTALAADKTYQVDVPATIAKTTPAPLSAFVAGDWYTPQDWADVQTSLAKVAALPAGEKGTGPALALHETTAPMQAKTNPQTDTDLADNFASANVDVTGNNPADLAAVGATASGAAGASVDVKVGIKNNGPADAVFALNEENVLAWLDVTVPQGTTVTKAPADCAPVVNGAPDGLNPGKAGGSEYLCLFDVIKVGDTYWYPFTLRVDSVVADATGTLTLTAEDGSALRDPNQANNTAKLIINPAGGTGGGGGLPITGVKAGLIGGAGVLIVALGIVFFVLNRRRRTRFVVED